MEHKQRVTPEEVDHFMSDIQDPWTSVAVAVRVSMLILPTLVDGMENNKRFLWFIDNGSLRDNYLFDVLHSCQYVWAGAWFKDSDLIKSSGAYRRVRRTLRLRRDTKDKRQGQHRSFVSAAGGVEFAISSAVAAARAAVLNNNDLAASAAREAVVDTMAMFFAAEKKARKNAANASRLSRKKLQVATEYGDAPYTSTAQKISKEKSAEKAVRIGEKEDTLACIAESDCVSFFGELRRLMDMLRTSSDTKMMLALPFDNFLKEKQSSWITQLRKYGSGFDYWAEWYEDRSIGKRVNSTILRRAVMIGDEISAKIPSEKNAYLKSLKDLLGTAPLNRVRAIFVGFGAAGKTSIIRVLNDEVVLEGKEEMTPGVEVKEWQLPDSSITADLWDFGGQVMAHATHQFFLRSRCLYVVVLDGRAEINSNEQTEYWLEHVRAFGSDAPVLCEEASGKCRRIGVAEWRPVA